MTPSRVKQRLKTIEKNQTYWDLEENKLQELCEHPSKTEKYCGDTGNYDKTADSYWIEYRCLDCGKFWMVDQ